jgi:ElaB/YqjD/DUF883 family membrane-anchored ribosome-binding protein
MTDNDDLGGKPKGQDKSFSETAREAKDKAVERAGEAVGGASKSATDAKDRVVNMASTTKDRVAQQVQDVRQRLSDTAHEVSAQAGHSYDRAVDVARSGYQAASGQVAASPMSSLIIAALVGLGVGWALRGQYEENRRRDWMANLPDYIRRRIG